MASTPAFSGLYRRTSGFLYKGTVKHFIAHTRPLTDLCIELHNLAKQTPTKRLHIFSRGVIKLM